MASSTLIQNLNTTQVSGLGVSSAVALTSMDRRQVETFKAGSAISSGDWVALDLGTAASPNSAETAAITVCKADGDRDAGAGITSTASVVVGVCLGPASSRDDDGSGGVKSGGSALVVIRGPVSAKLDNTGAAINKGSALVLTTLPGLAGVYTAAAVLPACGILMDTAVAGGGAGFVSRMVYVMPSVT
mgnify:CR=1 FL=1